MVVYVVIINIFTNVLNNLQIFTNVLNNLQIETYLSSFIKTYIMRKQSFYIAVSICGECKTMLTHQLQNKAFCKSNHHCIHM